MIEPRPVQGYLTPTGQFFESRDECRLAIAQSELEAECESHFPKVNVSAAFQMINKLAPYIKAYIDASYNIKARQAPLVNPQDIAPDYEPAPIEVTIPTRRRRHSSEVNDDLELGYDPKDINPRATLGLDPADI